MSWDKAAVCVCVYALCCKVRYVAEAIVCINCFVYVLLEVHEIRLQGLSGYIKKQVSLAKTTSILQLGYITASGFFI